MAVVLMWVIVMVCTQVFTKEIGRAHSTFTCRTIEESPRIEESLLL